MYPVNQFIVGGDSTYPQITDVDAQMKLLEEYKSKLRNLGQIQTQHPIWDKIDEEVNSLNDIQKQRLFENNEYITNSTKLQNLVNNELVKLVKAKVENGDGKSILENQLDLVKKLKDKIINDTNKELDLFNKFKEFSKTNPNITYDEFIKTAL